MIYYKDKEVKEKRVLHEQPLTYTRALYWSINTMAWVIINDIR